jgi:class 3 adenylate cyclase
MTTVRCATVFFADMVGFTAWSNARTASQVVEMLNTVVPLIDVASLDCSVEKIKTIGDAYWAAAGIPDANSFHADAVCRFARQFLRIVDRQNSRHPEWGGVQFRVGVNSGPLSGAVLGSRAISFEVFGPTSDDAEEIEKEGIPSQILISKSTRQLLVSESVASEQPVKLVAVHHGFTECFLLAQRDAASAEHAAASVSPRRGRGDGAADSQSSMSSSSRRCSSESGTSTNDGEQAAAAARRLFIAKKAEAFRHHQRTMQFDNGAADQCDIDTVISRYTKRKYNWFFLSNPDDDVERDFTQWVRHYHQHVRISTRVLTVVFVVFALASLGVDSIAVSPMVIPPTSSVLLAASVSLAFVSVLLSLLDSRHVVDDLIVFVSGCLLIIGVGLIPDSIVGNDPTYLIWVLSLSSTIGSVSTAWLLRFIGVVVFFLLPAWCFVYDSIMFSQHAGSMSIGCIFQSCFLVTMEKLHRQSFLDTKIAAFFTQQQQLRADEQVALLQTAVPEHVIPDLLVWMAADLDPKNSIKRVLPRCVVAFVKLYPRQMTAASAGALGSTAWLIDAHRAVDEVIDRHCSVVDKIKTIGDIVMLAGPFTEELTASEDAQRRAVCELLDAIGNIRRVVPVRAGLHVGEAVAAVLGTSRLAFDIFGDTVNIASRAMTTNPGAGCVTLTAAFLATCRTLALFPNSGSQLLPGGIAVSGPFTRRAKGKDPLELFDVVFPAADAIISPLPPGGESLPAVVAES